MHKLTSTMHKTPPIKNTKGEGEDSELGIEHQVRLSNVLTLYSKGLSQSDIAKKLDINQSTVSRDLKYLKIESRKQLELNMKEEVPFEFQVYATGVMQVIKKLWERIEAEDPNITIKDRNYALSLLIQSYSKRPEMLVGGPHSGMNAIKHVSLIHDSERTGYDLFYRYLKKDPGEEI